MDIKFAGLSAPKNGALALTVAEEAALGGFGSDLDAMTGGHLTRAMDLAEFKGKRDSVLELVAPSGVDLERLFLVGIGDPKELGAYDLEKLGGAIAGRSGGVKSKKLALAVDSHDGCAVTPAQAAALMASGFKLRSYVFDKYKSKASDKNGNNKPLAAVTVLTEQAAAARRAFADLGAIADGVHLARDLVNEPANILYPDEFAKRAKKLTKLGAKVDVLTEKDMEKLEMHALLGVGQGSVRDSRLAVMHWMGGKKGEAPVAFVGKGVTFDTGGISLKPGAGMGDMKGDMGGAACVTGLMHALAARKAKVNAIGVIGLVENMPDAAAQRPGDIVGSMSTQTIEILNTDAEGRLVLADALWYTQDKFKPKFMIDLATLTGAILVALGKEHAGIFSNDDDLAGQLYEAGQATGEKVWRLPLGKAYDKLIDTPNADMKNIGGRNAGSITAAQFLQRFVNDVPWVHIDIAGTAMESPKTEISQGWASGYGVRLLNRLVADNFEG
ncbi:MAG: leucyl aminopeptidase [Hyphomicrobiales bacterium]